MTVVDVVKSTAAKDVVLGSHHIQCPYQTFISGGELVGDNTEEGAYYLGYVYRSDTSDRVLTKGTTVYRYFSPITYDVLFDGNGATEGEMEPMQGCRYGLTYTLPLNSFKRNIKVRFDLQAEDAVFGDDEISIACPFEGWSDKFLLRMWSNYIPDTILMRHRRHYPDVLKETEVLCCPYIIVVIPIHCSSIWKVEACRQNTGN